ncbi:TonB-dependent receptor [Sphingomonas sp. S2-65]|uniref:TonB-dependent receptor n=1 Tax=Sphingomonas sp. S2-65 TaxID=2903960 RepID=UPI001F35358F|nr:TonB-dependent receptor [Sphingomonas sp. S2-65]UYY58034.1 TonB-dependent receptor [Sphingomonas sp. S2-65]
MRNLVIPHARLVDALNQLARETRADILFSPSEIGSTASVPLRGRMTLEEALSRLLADTPFTFRHTEGGAILIVRAAAEPPAIPEILVVGTRTQNVDIPRTRNDVQPYRVVDRSELAASHAGAIDDFFRTRVPSNAQVQTPLQQPALFNATPRSEISIRGTGEGLTLILVDGSRMPLVPDANGYFHQPDLNGLPVEAVERMEILNLTSGGIYGTGALGGIVNVVMRHEYEGGDAAVQRGLAEQGAGGSFRAYARAGLNWSAGRTSAELSIGLNRRDGLLAGERNYAARARAKAVGNSPGTILSRYFASDGVRVYSGSEPLTLMTADGIVPLGTNSVLLPRGSEGLTLSSLRTSPADQAALPRDRSGAGQSLLTGTSATSLRFNLRRQLGEGVQAFVDLIAFEDRGRAKAPERQIEALLAAGSPLNRFSQDVTVSFTSSDVGREMATDLAQVRLTGGLIARLGDNWSAVAHLAEGWTRVREETEGRVLVIRWIEDALAGSPGGRPPIDPLGDWSELVSGLRAYAAPYLRRVTLRNRMTDVSLRMAGPILDLPGGAATFTGLLQHRREDAPAALQTFERNALPRETSRVQPFGERTRSIYGELRLPLIEGAGPGVSAAELQLALRHDRVFRYRGGSDGEPAGSQASRTVLRQQALVSTVGARIRPFSGVMIRGSVASGAAPTPISQVSVQRYASSAAYPDLLRGGRLTGSEGTFEYATGAAPGLKPLMSRSTSVGFVLNEEGGGLPRFSVDVSQILLWRRLGDSGGGIPFILANEGRMPARVARAPLTAADAAAGLRAGVITAIDGTNLATGRSEVAAIDVELDHRLRFGGDELGLTANATWTPRYRTRGTPLMPWQRVSTLSLRANAGVAWSRGPVNIGLAAQFIGPYDAVNSWDFDSTKAYASALDLDVVPAQVYVDLTGGIRLPFARASRSERPLELRFAVLNLFDRRLPLAPNDASSSPYGDVRGRRFDLALSGRF